MRVFIAVLVLIFSLQSWTKADDISDFEIEGISIGDSALDYFSKKDIETNSRNYFKDKTYTPVQMDGYSFFENYDGVDFSFKTDDNTRQTSRAIWRLWKVKDRNILGILSWSSKILLIVVNSQDLPRNANSRLLQANR